MPRKSTKKVEESEVVEAAEEVVEAIEESEARKTFRAHIEKYASQNPEKFEQKKDKLLEKLNTL